MKVTKDGSGKWLVTSEHEEIVAGPFDTNAEAWRALDRMEGAPISPAEKRSEWVIRKIMQDR